MQLRPVPLAALTAAITLTLVLAGCGPRSDADDAAQAALAGTSESPGDRAGDGRPGDQASTALPPADDPDVLSGVPESIPLPPRDTPTAPLPDATEITYLCADGSDLRVRYDASQAIVTLGIDTVSTLALSASASTDAGGEVYIGQGQGLRRIGGVVEYDPGRGEDAIRRCRETSATA